MMRGGCRQPYGYATCAYGRQIMPAADVLSWSISRASCRIPSYRKFKEMVPGIAAATAATNPMSRMGPEAESVASRFCSLARMRVI